MLGPDRLVDAYLADPSPLGSYVFLCSVGIEDMRELVRGLRRRLGDGEEPDISATVFAEATLAAGHPLEVVHQGGLLSEVLISAIVLTASQRPQENASRALAMLARSTREAGPSAAFRGAALAHQLHVHDPSLDLLDAARDLARWSVEELEGAGDTTELAGALNVAAVIEARLWEATSRRAHLDGAVAYGRRLVIATEGTDFHAPCMAQLADQLDTRFSAYGNDADLDEALAVADVVEPNVTGDDPGSLVILSTFGRIRFHEYQRNGRVAELSRAIGLAELAAAGIGEGHPHRAGVVNTLAVFLHRRFELGGELVDLERSIGLAREATQMTPPSSPDLGIYASTLSDALARRHQFTNRPSDLDDAIAAAKAGLGATPPGDPLLAARLSLLAVRLLARFDERDQQEDLAEALALADWAVDLIPAGSPGRMAIISTLGDAFSRRSVAADSLADLARAIELFRESLALTEGASPDLPGTINNLAIRLERRYRWTRDPADRTEMIALLERWAGLIAGGRGGRRDMTMAGPGWWVPTLAELAAAGDEDLWRVTALVGAATLAGAQRLSTLPDDADEERRRAQAVALRQAVDGVAALTALAQVRAGGQPVEALALLESGLTTMAVERAGRVRYTRARAVAPQVVDALAEVADRLRLAIDHGGDVEALWDEHDELQARLERQVGRLTPHRSVEELAAVAKEARVVMAWVATTRHGGLLLSLDRGGTCTTRLLPALTLDRVVDWHVALHPDVDPDGTTRAVRGPDGTGIPDLPTVRRVLDELVAALAEATELTQGCWLVPAGLLASLPWQAQWPALRVHTSGALHAVTASAAAAARSERRAAAVVDPLENLPAAANEADAMREALHDAAEPYEVDIAVGDEATRAGVLGLRALDVLHVAAHGSDEPALKLAGGDRLRPEDLSDHPDTFGSLRLLFPNCCLSGSLPPTHLDEAAGFATAAAVAGSAATLAALWPVEDATAYWFAREFYASFAATADPHLAIREARKATAEAGGDPSTVWAYQLYGH